MHACRLQNFRQPTPGQHHMHSETSNSQQPRTKPGFLVLAVSQHAHNAASLEMADDRARDPMFFALSRHLNFRVLMAEQCGYSGVRLTGWQADAGLDETHLQI